MHGGWVGRASTRPPARAAGLNSHTRRLYSTPAPAISSAEQFTVEEAMSDVEETPVVEVAAGSTAPGEVSIEDALQVVIRNALKHHQGVARGLREAVKALQSEYAELCVLCDSVTEDSYAKLVEALCQEPENPIPLIKVSDAKKLGEWAGLSKLDRDGNARKVVGCSCLVIRQFGDRSPELDVLLNYFKSQ